LDLALVADRPNNPTHDVALGLALGSAFPVSPLNLQERGFDLFGSANLVWLIDLQ
jgi:hypothetical protein